MSVVLARPTVRSIARALLSFKGWGEYQAKNHDVAAAARRIHKAVTTSPRTIYTDKGSDCVAWLDNVGQVRLIDRCEEVV